MTLNLKNSCLDRTKLSLPKKWPFLIFNKLVRNVRLKTMLQLVDKKKIDCFSVDGICNHCNTVFEAMGCYFHYCPCQDARPSLTDKEIMRGIKKERKRPNAQRLYPTKRVQKY